MIKKQLVLNNMRENTRMDHYGQGNSTT
ncbi:uncharacterized protein METZ01_LOCUS222184, partial [marine metagenome]